VDIAKLRSALRQGILAVVPRRRAEGHYLVGGGVREGKSLNLAREAHRRGDLSVGDKESLTRNGRLKKEETKNCATITSLRGKNNQREEDTS